MNSIMMVSAVLVLLFTILLVVAEVHPEGGYYIEAARRWAVRLYHEFRKWCF